MRAESQQHLNTIGLLLGGAAGFWVWVLLFRSGWRRLRGVTDVFAYVHVLAMYGIGSAACLAPSVELGLLAFGLLSAFLLFTLPSYAYVLHRRGTLLKMTPAQERAWNEDWDAMFGGPSAASFVAEAVASFTPMTPIVGVHAASYQLLIQDDPTTTWACMMRPARRRPFETGVAASVELWFPVGRRSGSVELGTGDLFELRSGDEVRGNGELTAFL